MHLDVPMALYTGTTLTSMPMDLGNTVNSDGYRLALNILGPVAPKSIVLYVI